MAFVDLCLGCVWLSGVFSENGVFVFGELALICATVYLDHACRGSNNNLGR